MYVARDIHTIFCVLPHDKSSPIPGLHPPPAPSHPLSPPTKPNHHNPPPCFPQQIHPNLYHFCSRQFFSPLHQTLSWYRSPKRKNPFLFQTRENPASYGAYEKRQSPMKTKKTRRLGGGGEIEAYSINPSYIHTPRILIPHFKKTPPPKFDASRLPVPLPPSPRSYIINPISTSESCFCYTPHTAEFPTPKKFLVTGFGFEKRGGGLAAFRAGFLRFYFPPPLNTHAA